MRVRAAARRSHARVTDGHRAAVRRAVRRARTMVAMRVAMAAAKEKVTRKKSKAFHGLRMYSRKVYAVTLMAASTAKTITRR